MILFKKRPPDINIGPDYLHRWYVIPRNRFFNIYLHHILRSDDDRAMHDHPWVSMSIMLKGKMIEMTPKGGRRIRRGLPVFRKATHTHRLVITKPTWTLFITGPVTCGWGFWCEGRFVPWREFLDGRGCE